MSSSTASTRFPNSSTLLFTVVTSSVTFATLFVNSASCSLIDFTVAAKSPTAAVTDLLISSTETLTVCTAFAKSSSLLSTAGVSAFSTSAGASSAGASSAGATGATTSSTGASSATASAGASAGASESDLTISSTTTNSSSTTSVFSI